MSFENCTGTTAETCAPPCQLVYTSNEQDPVCFPPRTVPAHNLSDPDLVRIKQLINLQTNAFDGELRALHDTLHEYVDIRVRTITKLVLQDARTPEWRDVLAKIAADVMNDIGNLTCQICLDGFNEETGEAEVLKCTEGGGENLFPMHKTCATDMTAGYGDCPMCRNTATSENHSHLGQSGSRAFNVHNTRGFPDPTAEGFLDHFSVELGQRINVINEGRQRRMTEFEQAEEDEREAGRRRQERNERFQRAHEEILQSQNTLIRRFVTLTVLVWVISVLSKG